MCLSIVSRPIMLIDSNCSESVFFSVCVLYNSLLSVAGPSKYWYPVLENQFTYAEYMCLQYNRVLTLTDDPGLFKTKTYKLLMHVIQIFDAE